MVREGLGAGKETIIIPFSAVTKQGREEIWSYIESCRNETVPEITEAE